MRFFSDARVGVFSIIAITWASGVCSQNADAYVLTTTSNGQIASWRNGSGPSFVGNTINQSGLTANDIFTSVVRALDQWKYYSSGAIRYNYWQGTDFQTYLTNSDYNGVSSIYFISQSTSGQKLMDNGTIGLTQVWYTPATGDILETDISLNDRDFVLTKNPTDTTSGNASARKRVFIDNVITHELGHAYGLSHTLALQSTMMHVEFPDENHLSCDDWSAIQSSTNPLAGKGKASGRIVGNSGTAVFGAIVNAISESRGSVFATAITQPDGSYKFDALEPGNYYFEIEPFLISGTGLSPYYQSANTRICSGGHFARTSWTGGNPDGRSRMISVGSGAAIALPNATAECAGQEGTVSRGTIGATYLSGAPVIFTGSESHFGILDHFQNSSQEQYYALDQVGGELSISILSHTLSSPMHVAVELLDRTGNILPSSVISPVYSSESGFNIVDVQLRASNLATDRYYLRISPLFTGSLMFATPATIDAVPFFFVMGTTAPLIPSFAGALTSSSKCRVDLPPSGYQSPSSSPPSKSNGGACGTIYDVNRKSSSTPRDIAGWLCPWGLMIAFWWRQKEALASARLDR